MVNCSEIDLKKKPHLNKTQRVRKNVTRSYEKRVGNNTEYEIRSLNSSTLNYPEESIYNIQHR